MSDVHAKEPVLLFMGEVEERGFRCRIYDGSYPSARTLNRQPVPRPGGVVVLTGGGQCVCGRCLFESKCPVVKP